MKDISSNFITAIVVVHQSRKDYKTISKLFKVYCSTERKIIKWKTFHTAVSLLKTGWPSKFASKLEHAINRDSTDLS